MDKVMNSQDLEVEVLFDNSISFASPLSSCCCCCTASTSETTEA